MYIYIYIYIHINTYIYIWVYEPAWSKTHNSCWKQANFQLHRVHRCLPGAFLHLWTQVPGTWRWGPQFIAVPQFNSGRIMTRWAPVFSRDVACFNGKYIMIYPTKGYGCHLLGVMHPSWNGHNVVVLKPSKTNLLLDSKKHASHSESWSLELDVGCPNWKPKTQNHEACGWTSGLVSSFLPPGLRKWQSNKQPGNKSNAAREPGQCGKLM